ncbi:thiol:disulfide interchange protein DsbA/DsbL [Vibrio sp. WXL103]|uniref:thiol:disulfide interchange protein DsbA/DsbL n=1 Tax=unclassified Vibrio TaxID=2614977 RepID=UPI003EC4CCBC
MKKLMALFATILVSISANAANFKEGTHYTVLELEKSSKPVVNEFFSFYCPHCYQFEPVVTQLKSELPEGVKLNKNHVSFMGGPMGPSMSKAYATMLALKVEKQMAPVMFNRIHNLNQPPRDDDELRQIFVDEGIDGKKFDATFNGFAVDSMTRRFDKQFRDSGLRGVPAVIVSNIYMVESGSVSSIDEYIELVNYLVTK